MVIEVFLKDKDDIERLNKVACEQPFDMSVSCGYTIFDAKSFNINPFLRCINT